MHDNTAAILEYLSKNSALEGNKDEFMNTHVKELGSRLIMDVRAGAQVMPVFVYNPKSGIIIPEPVKPKPVEKKKEEIIRKSNDTSVRTSKDTDKIKEEKSAPTETEEPVAPEYEELP